MRGYLTLERHALAKIEADMNGIDRESLRVQPHQGEDFPIFASDARGFPKRVALCEAQNWRCAYCGITVHDQRVPDGHRVMDDKATVDEIVPRAAGGPAIWSNQVIACNLCNQGRGAMRARRYFRMVVTLGRRTAYAEGVRLRAEFVKANGRAGIVLECGS